MPSQKRNRKRAGREARRAAILAAQKARRRKRNVVVAGLVGVLIVGVAMVVNSGDEPTELKAASTTTIPAVEPVCPAADGSSPRTVAFTAPPPMCIDPSKSYTAEVATTKGSFTVALDAKAAPKTVNNFVFLARYQFFNGISFHRIVPEFVIQAGDPAGNGRGGPGYTFADELPPPNQYKAGSVAMANKAPNTNGSQFFVVLTDERAKSLQPGGQPAYSLFGQVTEGMDVVQAIGALGGPDEKPTQPVTMQTVTIKET